MHHEMVLKYKHINDVRYGSNYHAMSRNNPVSITLEKLTVVDLLTPWSRVLPEKLKRPTLLKKFPAFYGTRRFITAFTRTRHLSLS
jgi:hypothetical protein